MATNIFTFYSDSLKGSFDSAYVGKCLQAASKELLTLTDSISEYHYTLYYYDQAGNLVKTVPPAGVVRSYRQSWLDSVKAARASGTLLAPPHTLTTNYRYNTLNTMIAQSTPDAGQTSFWYDRLGRLVLSQNAKQLSEGVNYSYTLYDPLSRITEVGQINSGVGAVTTSTTKVPASWETWLGNNATNRYQVTNTVYDLPAAGIDLLLAQNPSTLRNRVSYSSVTPGQKGSGPVYSTYYNYDIEGNVSSLLQDYGATSPMGTNDQQYKQIDYGYDLVSGKVNSVSYQPGKTDAFMHFYQYDAENRLTDVYTTADSVTVEHEAHYEYYKHGPLARALIGQNQVQGLDYAYTLQGWLKAVNGSTLDSVNDMGRDGDPTVQSRKYIAKDAYGFSLHYFEGDYQPINGSTFLTALKAKLGASYKGLYNGNISSMAVNIGILNNPKLYNYRYDQLNRLAGMDMLNGTNTGLNLWTNNLAASNDYTEKASYDPNGNILTYIRHGYGATPAMDSMTYHYQDGTNKLNHIADGVASGNYPNDLDNQSADNYTYDAAGNLIRDNAAGITTDMTWSVYGKLLTIPSKSVSYIYDAAGNRIGKTVGSTNTWYVRDAQGNILTTYSGAEMTMQERDLYGSSRLGIISNPAALSTTTQYLDHLGSGTLFTFTRGTKLFELTNHLGNVLATVSDKKFGTAVTGIPSQIAYYIADVKSAQDYYPFGMEMPGRQFNATTYTYSFNRKRDDKDAEYGWQDYGMREYDKRRAQFISVDQLAAKYPMLSPFQFGSNRPIDGIDLNGLEYLPYGKSMYQLQYTTSVSTYQLNSGGLQTVTTHNVIVNVVYSNIPTSLQDPQKNNFKYVFGGPVTAWGRDWDNSKDGQLIYEKGRYYNNGPKFNGLPPGEGEPSNNIKPVGKSYDDDVMISTNLGKTGTALSAVKDGVEIGENYLNTKVWDALTKESDFRRGFYDATNIIDEYRAHNLIGDKMLLTPSGRVDLVNFLTDGTLNTTLADNLKDVHSETGNRNFRSIRRNLYGNALRVAYTGLQIMKSQGVDIRAATKSAVENTLNKYKANGGGNEYDELHNRY